MRQASFVGIPTSLVPLAIVLAVVAASALPIRDDAPLARAAAPMLDRPGPGTEPAEAPSPAETPAKANRPFTARPNSVVPGGMTIDLRGRKQPIEDGIDRDGTVPTRRRHAPGVE